MNKERTASEAYQLTPRKGVPGRRTRPGNEGLPPHLPRAPHDAKDPVHVWSDRAPDAPSFRDAKVKSAIVAKMIELKERGPQILRYTIKDDSFHLLCEAKTGEELSRRVQLLFARITFAVNKDLRRSGSMFRARHHREELTTPARIREATTKHFSGPDSAAGPHAK